MGALAAGALAASALAAATLVTACSGNSAATCTASDPSCGADAGVETCSAGDTRCDPAGNIETCQADGSWTMTSSCDTGLCQTGQCAVDHELEPADQKGQNDTFDTAQPIPFATDFKAHVGQDGDIDTFNFQVAEAGTVKLTLDFTDSWTAGKLVSFTAVTRTDAFPESTVSVGLSDPMASDCRTSDPLVICQSHLEVTQSVTPVQGVYTLTVQGAGDPQLPGAGFDVDHPYTVRIEYTPGPTLEADQPPVDGHAVGDADVWRAAEPITFDATTGKAELASYGFYWNDVDWYRFDAKQDGTLQVTADVDAAEDGDPSKVVLWEDGELLAQGDGGLTATDFKFAVSDSPNCPVDRGEFLAVKAGTTYYLRLNSFESSTQVPYRVHLALLAGAPEDSQPGDVGAVDTAATADDLGTLTPGTPKVVSSYFWHYFDWDWYKVHVPAGNGGHLTAKLDYTAMYDKLGWFPLECQANPYGIVVWAYLFDQPWFESASQDFSQHLTRSTDDDVPTQNLAWDVAANADDRDYYVLVMSRENWDQDDPYQLTVSYTAN